MTSAFDAYATTYERTVAESISFSGLRHAFFLQAKVAVLAEIFKAHFGSLLPSLLDIGCGIGLMHPMLAPHVRALAGTDASEGALACAREQHPGVDYRAQRTDALPWPAASFDVSLAVCVLHHVRPNARDAMIADMRRVTRPGGLVVLIEHNPRNPLTRLAVKRCPFDHDAVLLTAGESRGLLGRGNLCDVRSRHFLVFPSAAAWVSHVERSLRHIPLGAQFVAYGEV